MCTWWCIPKQARNGLQGEKEWAGAENEKNGGGGGSRAEARVSINEEKLEWKEMKVELSWRGCCTRPFLLQATAAPLRAPRNEAGSDAGCSQQREEWERWIRGGEEVAFACPRVRRALTPSPQVIYHKPFSVFQQKQREENLLISSSNFVYEHINRGGEEIEAER